VSQQALPHIEREDDQGEISGPGAQIVGSTPSRPMRYDLVLKADAGSVPNSTTGI
jgi:hypothetical protein